MLHTERAKSPGKTADPAGSGSGLPTQQDALEEVPKHGACTGLALPRVDRACPLALSQVVGTSVVLEAGPVSRMAPLTGLSVLCPPRSYLPVLPLSPSHCLEQNPH